MTFEVIVQLKKEVLDPEARAIQETLARLGVKGVKGVHVAKRYLLEFTDQSSDARDQAEKIAREYLANPVSETYQVKPL